MLKVGIIGAGGMGRYHASIYRKISGVELAGISDVRSDASRSVADEFKIRAFDSADELINLGGVDIVDVCTPTVSHKENVIRAALAGKHVFCEKPISRNLEDALEMVDVCGKSGVKFMVGQVVRFFPEYIKMKQLIEQGAVGRPAVARASRSVGVVAGWNNWYSNYELSGGFILETMIHEFDMLRWYFGEVKRVHARMAAGQADESTQKRADPFDNAQGQSRACRGTEYALVTLRFDNGVIAHIEGSKADFLSFRYALEVAGSDGLIDFDSRMANPISISSRKDNDSWKEVAALSAYEEDPFYKELSSFVNCVEKNLPVPIDGMDAAKSLRVALAALESVETGEAVDIPTNKKGGVKKK